jgi:3-hydroxyacyl-[acyl-carrier-protein] dehydratase
MNEHQHREASGYFRSAVSVSELLATLPQQRPFRFIDEILEIDDKRVVSCYRFRENEFFYPGHFPDRPVTPGVILLEAMAQGGMVLQSLYLLARELGVEESKRYRTLITGAELECFEPVYPETSVVMHCDLVAWRSRRIRVQVKMRDTKGALVAQSTVSGLAVLWNQERFSRLEKEQSATLADVKADAQISS